MKYHILVLMLMGVVGVGLVSAKMNTIPHFFIENEVDSIRVYKVIDGVSTCYLTDKAISCVISEVIPTK